MPNVIVKSLKALTLDIAEGYVAVNPIFLCLLDQLKEMHRNN
jgi:hypothetical protein